MVTETLAKITSSVARLTPPGAAGWRAKGHRDKGIKAWNEQHSAHENGNGKDGRVFIGRALPDLVDLYGSGVGMKHQAHHFPSHPRMCAFHMHASNGNIREDNGFCRKHEVHFNLFVMKISGMYNLLASPSSLL